MTITREPLYEDAPSGRLAALGRHVVAWFASIGQSVRLMVESFAYLPGTIFRCRGRGEFVKQLCLQVGLALRRFNQEVYLGAAVMISLIREMGPFVTGICLSACVGSAMAAELGTMTVNDEVAALEIMSIPPVRFLAAPRMGGLLVMSPLLAFYACVLGVVGGGVVGYTQFNVSFSQYMSSAMTMAELKDLFVGLLKATVFGVVICTVSCHQGFATRMGAVGVGRATQRSVIISFLLILMFGYMITRMFYLEF